MPLMEWLELKDEQALSFAPPTDPSPPKYSSSLDTQHSHSVQAQHECTDVAK